MDLSDCIIVDTETTGLGRTDEVCELSIIDGATGDVLLDTLLRPSRPIPAQASAIHGITDADVASAPQWPEIHALVQSLLNNYQLVAYNAEFDVRLLQQTARQFGHLLRVPHQRCAMRWLQAYRQPPGKPEMRWLKLTRAAELYGVEPEGTAHRALCDARMTLDVIHAVCAEDHQHVFE